MATFTRDEVNTQVQNAIGGMKGQWVIASKTAHMIVVHCVENNHTDAFIADFFNALLDNNQTMARAFEHTLKECTGMVIKRDKETGDLTVSKSKTVWKRISGDISEANIMKLSTYPDNRYIMKSFIPEKKVTSINGGKKDTSNEKAGEATTIDKDNLTFAERVQYEGNIFQKTCIATGETLTLINALDSDDALVKEVMAEMEALNKKLVEHHAQLKQMKEAAVASRLMASK
jgi:hypothetical protein